MGHPVYRVKAFEVVGPYRIRIEFSDGLVQPIDFRPILEGELYSPLRDLNEGRHGRTTLSEGPANGGRETS